MKSSEYQDLRGRIVTVTLYEGDMIDMRSDNLVVEIGPNDTMRAVVNGQPDPKGWQPIPDKAVPALCRLKVYSY